MSFVNTELDPTLADKAAPRCFALVMNHSFVDVNKRIGHAAMEVCLIMNRFELTADGDDSEFVILCLMVGELERALFMEWVVRYVTKIDPGYERTMACTGKAVAVSLRGRSWYDNREKKQTDAGVWGRFG